MKFDIIFMLTLMTTFITSNANNDFNDRMNIVSILKVGYKTLFNENPQGNYDFESNNEDYEDAMKRSNQNYQEHRITQFNKKLYLEGLKESKYRNRKMKNLKIH